MGLASCGEVSSVIETEKIIAVKYGSANELACEEYKEYTKVTYNSASDVVLAVENKKVDCGILDDFELNSYINAGREIKQKEKCQYSLDYCAYFALEDDALQELFNDAIEKLKEKGVINKIKTTHLKGESYMVSQSNNKNGTLTMLCDPSFANRVYTDKNGNVVGLDVDIAREICNTLGYDLEIVTADSDELFTRLQDGEGDFVISASEVNEERAEYYLLSDTYFTLDYFLIERK
jgi:ABC-type amino acid transport substrate-binding protein